MNLHDVLRKAGKKPTRKRVGRGPGSGNGKTSGRGHKGARSRSGWKNRRAYEGGQMPLVRRLPKRGFSNALFRKRFDIVNVSVLEEQFESGATVDVESLTAKGAIKLRHGRLKVLADGDLSKSLTVVADDISEEARRKIEAAGGTVTLTGIVKEAKKR